MMLKKLIIIALCGMTNLALAEQTASTPMPTNNTEAMVIDNRQKINDIIFSKDYTIVTPNTRWQQKETPTNTNNDHQIPSRSDGIDLSNFIDIVSSTVKMILILMLIGFFYWLYLKREIWLAWFANISRNKKGAKKLKVNQHLSPALTPMWYGLPEREQLVNTVRQALLEKNWLLALSILYRGTLREILPLHDLPITKASTEQQCQWLLQKAETCQPQEANFFKSLVNLWIKIAYGKQLPNQEQEQPFSQHIEQLLNEWQQLYGWQSHGGQDA